VLLRSRANTLVSVRQVTQRNTGRKTAGIDGQVALTSESRADVAVRVHPIASLCSDAGSSPGRGGKAPPSPGPTSDNPEHREIIGKFIQPIAPRRAAVQYEFSPERALGSTIPSPAQFVPLW
jgi:RNA-directed DNA polymerase